ncbi:AraC family transcriptional regulator [Marinomonas rhizomae]|uniref:AraC family transcriptional regulator n=1 Tax=Marinomonas rhizomae TaxID=491948 RepID=A0A366J9B9_9GAMM|nr:AraC family transcriptional regulator [Marinomonas rhizomae]RBP83457.1 AraC family transcriptional regulator [Marinomonas rhizomae]RNF74011.1 AraC family transcriptional regulator [Marinomonas rhizomae]
MENQARLSFNEQWLQIESLSLHENGSAFQAIAQAKAHIEQHYKESINLDSLADLVGLTRFSLAKQFRQLVGVSPYQYVCRVRIRNAQSLIEQGERPTEIAGAVGFFDQSHLAKHFKRLCGITPSQYRERFCKA